MGAEALLRWQRADDRVVRPDLFIEATERGFLDASASRPIIQRIRSAGVRVAHSLGLAMIAEGVETTEPAQFLHRHGVQFAQGWLFGKPMSWREFGARIDSEDPPDGGA